MLQVMKDIQLIFDTVFFGNTVQQYGISILLLLVAWLLKRFVTRISGRLVYGFLTRKARVVSPKQFHDLIHKPVGFLFMLLIVYLALSRLSFPPEWEMAPSHVFGLNMILYRGFFVLLYAAFIWIGMRVVDLLSLIFQTRAGQADNKFSAQLIPFLFDGLKLIVIVFGILIYLGSILRVNVGTLVAGLGIGGLAVALAAKESLENLIGSFTIFLDKPFVVGDMVTVGTTTGVVERVGFRSTRIRTLDKSFVTLPNKKMVDSELDNLSLRTFRRANFTVGLTYSTSIAQIKAIVDDIQKYIDQHPNTNQDGRVRFKDFGSSSLDIMVVYFVDTMDWTTYLDVKQEINYRIMEIVAHHGAAFAFPTTSVYIEKNKDK
jgi:MscS family membrane protein